uniref:Replication protein A 70 kDa DNA-binding subunit B/D first OB fold domain-containing protein n=1 Tax=Noccaea caerulescens TaxID=107243 RepID=A0A1J3HYH3_NOCCA
MAPPAKRTTPTAPTSKTFGDLQGKFFDDEIIVRLIHSWEARNFKKGNLLMGVELLLIDRKSTTIQAFISANRLHGHKSALKSNRVYRLKKFMITPCKTVYKVASHRYGICFTDETSFVEDSEGLHELPAQLFRLRTYQELAPLADTGIDLFDIIGHIRLISGDNLDTATPMSVAPPPTTAKATSMLFLHVQLEEFLIEYSKRL